MQELIGTFKLIKYGYQSKNDNVFKPISEWYTGLIHYSDTGYMNVIVRFAEKPKAFDEIVSYAGTYKVEGNQIIHQVISSARPEYECLSLVRTYKVVSDLLTVEFENTDEFIKFATWQRIKTES